MSGSGFNPPGCILKSWSEKVYFAIAGSRLRSSEPPLLLPLCANSPVLTPLPHFLGKEKGFFLEKTQGGGGVVISDPKKYIADFVGSKAVYFGKNAM